MMQQVPKKYRDLSRGELFNRIHQVRGLLGESLIILGHHYQRDEVLQFADFTGDSLKLARHAAESRQAKQIIFCGVHFMAESADILCNGSKNVILPDRYAGCTMSDMAPIESVSLCWQKLSEWFPGQVIPVVYINSSAEVKALAGRNGGTVCTSSNAIRALQWALRHGERVLFIPDQHLGQNSAYHMGIPLEQMVVWDPARVPKDSSTLKKATIVLWKGHCSVHQMFKISHVVHFRKSEPDRQIIVHPECEWEVVQAANRSGSTEGIIQTVETSNSTTRWAVGTEIHLVDRLAQKFPPGKVVPLTRFGCLCSTMYRIDPIHLLWVLENLLEGNTINRIQVKTDIASLAKVALSRMLEL